MTQPPAPAPPDAESTGSTRPRWVLPVVAGVALLVGVGVGLGLGYLGYLGGAFGEDSGGEGPIADQNARSACESLERWGGPEAAAEVEREGIPATWLGYAVYGSAQEAAELDERYQDLGDAGEQILVSLTRLNYDQLGEAAEQATRECADLGF